MYGIVLFNLALLSQQTTSPPTAEGPEVTGIVTQLKVIENLVQGDRSRFVDIQLNWKAGKVPVLVSSSPGKAVFQSQNSPDLTIAEGSSLVATENPMRHTWTVRLPENWISREPWRCVLEGSSVVADRFIEIPLGRVGELMERLKLGPIEAAKKGQFRCLIGKMERRGNRTSIRIRVEIDSHGVDLESYQSWVVFNRLQSKVGDLSREPFGYSIEGQDSTFAEVTYHLPAALPADATLSYRALASMRKAPIRLEFKGIPPW